MLGVPTPWLSMVIANLPLARVCDGGCARSTVSGTPHADVGKADVDILAIGPGFPERGSPSRPPRLLVETDRNLVERFPRIVDPSISPSEVETATVGIAEELGSVRITESFPEEWQGGKQCKQMIGGNCPVGSCPVKSSLEHCLKNPPPARLQRYGHCETVASLIPHDDLNNSPVPGSTAAGVSVRVGSIDVQVAIEEVVAVEPESRMLSDRPNQPEGRTRLPLTELTPVYA